MGQDPTYNELKQLVAQYKKKQHELREKIKLANHEIQINRLIRKANKRSSKHLHLNVFIQNICSTLVKIDGYHEATIMLIDEADKTIILSASSRGEENFTCNSEKIKDHELPHCIQKTVSDSGSTISPVSFLTCPNCPLQPANHELPSLNIRLSAGKKELGVLMLAMEPAYVESKEIQGMLTEFIDALSTTLQQREYEKHYHHIENIFRYIPQPMCLVSSDYRYLVVNETYGNLYGLPPNLILGHTPHELLGSHIFETEFKSHLDNCLAGNTVTFESFTIFPSGPSWMEVSYFPYRDKAGVISGVLIHRMDITARKKVEQELLLSQHSLEHIDYSIFWIKADGTIFRANTNACEKLGYTKNELLQLKMSDIDPGYSSRKRNNYWQELKRKGVTTNESVHYKKNEESYPVALTAHYLTFEENEFEVSIAKDITERKTLEKRILLAQKMEALSTLAGGIAHDFNNILSSIIGFTELARLKVTHDEATTKRLSQVIDSGLQAKKLVKHLVTFSKNADVQKTDLLIVPLLKECIKLLHSSIPSNIKLYIEVPDHDLIINADPAQMHLALMNLFDNSVQAMAPDGGSLSITANTINLADPELIKTHSLQQGSYVQIIITDTGCGIPESHITKIFEPFFSTRTRGESTGMGLSVSYGIIQEMKGHISAESTVGTGSSFILLIPEKVVENDDQFHAKVALQKGKGSILHVDDDQSILEWTSQLLEGLGYNVTSCQDGEQALAEFIMDPYGYDLLLTDLTMPGMTGLALAKKIKMVRSDVAIVLSTGFSEGVSQETLQQHGIAEIIMKPMIAGRLSEVVKDSLTYNNTE